MKKMYSSVLGLFLVLAAPSLAFADISIQLGGGTAAPGQKLSVDATKLLPNVNYKLNCTVNSPTPTMMHFSIGGVFGYDNFPALVNSKNIGSISLLGQNGMLNAGTNDFTMPVYRITLNRSGAILDFLNLDDSASIVVSNCVATPV
jgi:hypothetical protein